MLGAPGQTWDLLWPPRAKPAYGSGNQDKTRFPRTKLDLGNRLVILDRLSREECYHSTDLHTDLYETELKLYSLLRESHQPERAEEHQDARAIPCREKSGTEFLWIV